ncbi:MAG: hypothetical protein KA498_12530 [Neisseriaceae bacterium]|nr:hypothetical protein [Neisseriaceae bacterium]
MMHYLKQYGGLFLALFFGAVPSAWALDCYKNGATSGAQNALEQIMISPLGIPADTPVGTKIWESEIINVTAHCGRVQKNVVYENVYFYFNPRGPNLDSASGLAFGLEVISPVQQDLDNPSARFDTGRTVYRIASQGPTWIDVPVSFRLYLKTTRLPNNAERPITGNYAGPNVFQAFQFDGVKGVNIVQGTNLRYDLTNLRNIKFLACGADVSVLPENQDVDFGSQHLANFSSQGELTRNFTLRAVRRGCADTFSIDLRLDPKMATVNNQFLDLNNGLQIGIYDQGKRVDFGKYYPFVSFSGNNFADKTFEAKLTKIPGREVKVGPFNASLIYRINYK